MEKPQLRCEFDPCQKRLIDFCFVCAITGMYFCDEICCERYLQETVPKEVIKWQ